jgi:HSP20 family protein
MKLAKMSPALANVRQDVDRVFERFFEPNFWPAATTRGFEAMWEPMIDLSESAKEYVVRLEAPGMARDDFDVALDGNLLTLSGKRELRKEEQGEDFLWQERQEGRFLRSIRLPVAVEKAKIEAIYTDGLLTVRLPKSELAAKTKVTVK